MRLIANKPCSFGGRQFYIDDEIPANLVTDARTHEKYGVITIVSGDKEVPGNSPGTFYTQEQVEKMLAEAIDEAVNNTILELEQKQKEVQEYAAELKETETGIYEGMVQIAIKSASDGQYTAIPSRPEEIQQVFSIMQLNAEDASKAIADVRSENALILLHAADSRKMVKNAAKEQADKLFSIEGFTNESSKGNETTGTNTEGVDT